MLKMGYVYLLTKLFELLRPILFIIRGHKPSKIDTFGQIIFIILIYKGNFLDPGSIIDQVQVYIFKLKWFYYSRLHILSIWCIQLDHLRRYFLSYLCLRLSDLQLHRWVSNVRSLMIVFVISYSLPIACVWAPHTYTVWTLKTP